jgi:hypothetical protein
LPFDFFRLYDMKAPNCRCFRYLNFRRKQKITSPKKKNQSCKLEVL